MKFKKPLLILLLFILTACGSSPYPNSDHYADGHFHNHDVKAPKGFWDVVKWMWTRSWSTWPAWVDNTNKPSLAATLKPGEISATFVNHATYLIQLPSINCLTDPVFSERVSPLSWWGPKRVRAPGILMKDLPHIDCVVISHNHYDHMDKASIRGLTKKDNPLFIVPLGNLNLLKSFGAGKVVELDWWQKTSIPNSDVTVTLVPAQHWSRRGLLDRDKALWGGFVIQSPNSKVYFAGDTGYGKFFTAINKKLGDMDLSLLPIGAYEPAWLMHHHHLNPEEAVQAHLDLKSKLSLGIHFGTFQLSDEKINAPLEQLKMAKETQGLRDDQFKAPLNGATTVIRLSVPSPSTV